MMEQIGRYRVLRPLGQGGMGQVFLAEDPMLERRVALKLLYRDPNRALRREAKTLAALSHPNIVTVFEIGEHEGFDFIAMEYLPGRSMRELLGEPNPPSREELIAIVTSVAIALGAAHAQGILHRDIKPENVVTTPVGVKVVDFGIARRLEERASGAANALDLYEVLLTPSPEFESGVDTVVSAGTQTVFGTPAYMAPEVLGGEPSTEASDVYSLGIVLYECIAGKRPYDSGNLIETIAAIIQAPSIVLDDPLAPLIRRMLAREPEQRPRLAEVTAALHGKPADVPRSRTRGFAIATAVLVVVGGVAAYAVLGRSAPEPEVETTVAIAPVSIQMVTWGTNKSDPDENAKTIAKVEITGAKLSLVAVPGRLAGVQLQAARETRARYLLTFKIVESRDTPELEGTADVTDVATGKPVGEPIVVKGRSTELRLLLYDLLDAAIAKLAPGAKTARTNNRALAQTFVQDGRGNITSGNFDRARTDFESAVAADPTFHDGWYGLALTLGWTEAPEDLVLQAAEKASELAPEGPRKELMRGVAMFFSDRFTEARLVLEKLDTRDRTDDEKVELLYYLADANWHDGRHDAAQGYFERGLKVRPHARYMAIHPVQYLIARRIADRARLMTGIAGFHDTTGVEFAIRDYKTIAAGSHAGWRLGAKTVLGLPIADTEITEAYSISVLESSTYQIARAAEVGDLAKARTLFEAAWSGLGKQPSSGEFYVLEALGEVLLVAGMTDEARKLVKLLGDNSVRRQRRGYHRLSILTAALAKDPSLIVRVNASERNTGLARAVDAELAGDHGAAAGLLAALVANPTFTWDYAERAALIRNLRALGRTKDIAGLCADTLEPAIYRHAYMPLRRACKL